MAASLDSFVHLHFCYLHLHHLMIPIGVARFELPFGNHGLILYWVELLYSFEILSNLTSFDDGYLIIISYANLSDIQSPEALFSISVLCHYCSHALDRSLKEKEKIHCTEEMVIVKSCYFIYQKMEAREMA